MPCLRYPYSFDQDPMCPEVPALEPGTGSESECTPSARRPQTSGASPGRKQRWSQEHASCKELTQHPSFIPAPWLLFSLTEKC